MRWFVVTIAAVALAVAASAEVLHHHVYTPATLPGAQGWTFSSSGAGEDEVFSLDGDVLVLDTLGWPLQGDDWFRCQYHLADDRARSATFRLRARVTGTEQGEWGVHPGFVFGGWPLSWGPMHTFGLDDEGLLDDDDQIMALATGQWHDYTLVTRLDETDTPVVSILVDGAPVTSHAGLTGPLAQHLFMLGDITGEANARIEIATIEIVLFSGPPLPTGRRSLSTIKSAFTD